MLHDHDDGACHHKLSPKAWAKAERVKCRAKAHYRSEAIARCVGMFSLQAAVAQGIDRVAALWPYQCPWCGRWHLTSRQGHKERWVRPITAKASGLL